MYAYMPVFIHLHVLLSLSYCCDCEFYSVRVVSYYLDNRIMFYQALYKFYNNTSEYSVKCQFTFSVRPARVPVS